MTSRESAILPTAKFKFCKQEPSDYCSNVEGLNTSSTMDSYTEVSSNHCFMVILLYICRYPSRSDVTIKLEFEVYIYWYVNNELFGFRSHEGFGHILLRCGIFYFRKTSWLLDITKSFFICVEISLLTLWIHNLKFFDLQRLRMCKITWDKITEFKKLIRKPDWR